MAPTKINQTQVPFEFANASSFSDQMIPYTMYMNGDDTLYGDHSGNTLSGYGGNDTLFGYDGNDKLNGGAGNDRLYGGADNDILYGGTGKDLLTGGSGNDAFVFKFAGESGLTSATADVIKDLQMWDRIDVPDAVLNGHHSVVQNTSVTSIEQALGLANYFDSALYGDSNATASLWANPTTNTSYLLLDLNTDGTYDSGVILEGIGNPGLGMLDWSLM
ncbi:MAG: hypothetical protein V4517_11930 [Pseudomonadota bacterium]